MGHFIPVELSSEDKKIVSGMQARAGSSFDLDYQIYQIPLCAKSFAY
jgi:hypothetical protein